MPPHEGESVTRLAPAKINLALHVTGKQDDGYHRLESLVVFTELGDRITVCRASEDLLTLAGPFGQSTPADRTNLVLKARDALRERYCSNSMFPVSIKLEKRLPLASGIGGGSSDAAATLKALGNLWGLDFKSGIFSSLGLELGADIPMCLHARPLIARGIGQDIQTLRDFPILEMLLVNPGIHLATPRVFAGLDYVDNEEMALSPRLNDIETVCQALARTRNDLQPSAVSLVPEIQTILAALDRTGALVSRMSGSGPTCFGLFRTSAESRLAATRLCQEYPHWFVTATRTLAVQK